MATSLLAIAAAADSPGTLDRGPRAALVPSPQPLAVGVVGEITVAVRTPAGHRVQPIPSPRLGGAEIVRTHTEVREHPGGGWLHRTHWRVRPLEPGPLAWPATDVTVVSPAGEETRLALGARIFDVTSVMRPGEDERAPYGLVDPTAEDGGAGFAVGALVGAAATAVALGLVAASRRRRAPASHDEPPPAPARPRPRAPRDDADDPGDPLCAARRALPADPRRAATLAATALREAVADRLHVDLRALTTEEIDRERLVMAPGDVVDELVRLLARHDATRFPARPAEADEVAHDVEASAALLRRLGPARERGA